MACLMININLKAKVSWSCCVTHIYLRLRGSTWNS